jgi:hypothetical protein
MKNFNNIGDRTQVNVFLETKTIDLASQGIDKAQAATL